MSKFEISLELTGLKLSIKGEKDQIPQLAEAVNQLGGLLTPAASVAVAALPPVVVEAQPTPPTPPEEPTGRRSPKPAPKKRPQKEKAEDLINWKHDPGKWGNPVQQWGPGDKMLWLLLVLRTEANKQELTASEIYTTFNRYFKEAGALITKNATRELRKLKAQSPALIGETPEGTSSKWFLTQEGIKRAEKLVHDLLQPTPTLFKETGTGTAS